MGATRVAAPMARGRLRAVVEVALVAGVVLAVIVAAVVATRRAEPRTDGFRAYLPAPGAPPAFVSLGSDQGQLLQSTMAPDALAAVLTDDAFDALGGRQDLGGSDWLRVEYNQTDGNPSYSYSFSTADGLAFAAREGEGGIWGYRPAIPLLTPETLAGGTAAYSGRYVFSQGPDLRQAQRTGTITVTPVDAGCVRALARLHDPDGRNPYELGFVFCPGRGLVGLSDASADGSHYAAQPVRALRPRSPDLARASYAWPGESAEHPLRVGRQVGSWSQTLLGDVATVGGTDRGEVILAGERDVRVLAPRAPEAVSAVQPEPGDLTVAYRIPTAAPIVAVQQLGDVVLVATTDRRLTAYLGGVQLWSATTDDAVLTLRAAGDYAAALTASGTLTCFDVRTGGPRWHAELDVRPAVLVAGPGIVVVHGYPGALVALAAADGRELFRNADAQAAAAVVTADAVYVADLRADLQKLDLTGRLLWQRPVSGASLAVVGDRVVVGGSRLTGLAPDGSVLWSAAEVADGLVETHDGRLLATNTAGSLLADPGTGAIERRWPAATSESPSGAVTRLGYVFEALNGAKGYSLWLRA